MKNRLLKLVLLVLLLCIFPMNLKVYAEDLDSDIKEVSYQEETNQVDKKESSQEISEIAEVEEVDEDSILVEDEVILSEENVLESDEISKEKYSEDKVITSDELDLNEGLEISDIEIVEPVRGGGGGSSGGGGSFSGSVGEGPKIEFFIQKIDKETGNPMEVAFKITDLETGKSHIVITKPDGKSNLIGLFSSIEFEFSLNPYLGPSPEGEIRSEDIEKFKKDVEDNKDKYVNLENMPFPIENREHDINPPIHGGGSGEGMPPYGPYPGEPYPKEDIKHSVNENDKVKTPESNKDEYFILDKSGEIYHLDKFSKDDNVVFEVKRKPIEVILSYGWKIGEKKFSKEEHFSFKDYNYENVKEAISGKYASESISSEFIDFIKKRAYSFINEEKIDLGDNGVFYYGSAIIKKEFDDRPFGKEYHIEELNSDTNMGYNLVDETIKLDYIKREVPDPEDPDKKIEYKFPILLYRNKETGEFLPMETEEREIIDPYAPPEIQTTKIIIPFLKIENERFKFSTLASDPKDQEIKKIEKSSNSTIRDKINFSNFLEGSEYEFVGKLIHKASGKEVKTYNPIVYKTGKIDSNTNFKDGINLDVNFDASAYEDGDEFILVYKIYQDGKLVGHEYDLNNELQSFKIFDKPTPPPGDTPPPPGEVPPPEEEVPPHEDEVPPPEKKEPKENESTPSEVEKELVSEEVIYKVKNFTDDRKAPQTFDPGISAYIGTGLSSVLGLLWIQRKKKF